ncbi:MAG: NADH-dependent dehydrogenase family protein [Hyphomonadaceae bacterium]|nr:MAG: NADH-dependent dehydrogenase family protein [Hyphomonadaceae bacterium]KAF0183928.1 MAG: NADH-dependent dehydrogenase family protein [Hyphomonadaceae bacterium]
MAQIKLGIIGCGLISHAHAIAAQKSNERIKIVAAASRSDEKRHAWCAQYGAMAFENTAQMLAEMNLDGVIIATPPATHFENMVSCIKAGAKAILCEKPLITRIEDCVRLKEVATDANCTILEGFMYRHHKAFQEFETTAQSVGKLDTIFAEFNMKLTGSNDNWRQSDKASGGIAFDFLCYVVDFCNLMAKSKPKSAFAFGRNNPNSGLLENISGQVLYENEIIATLRASQNSSFSQKIILSASAGQVEMPIGFAISDTAQIITTRTEKFIDQQVSIKEVDIDEDDGTLIHSSAFAQQLRHFADIIEKGAPSLCGIDDALRNIEVTLALLSSIENRQPYLFANESK